MVKLVQNVTVEIGFAQVVVVERIRARNYGSGDWNGIAGEMMGTHLSRKNGFINV